MQTLRGEQSRPGTPRPNQARKAETAPAESSTEAVPADPDDAKQGDNWDHVALDPEHRLVVSVVPGKRTVENVEALVQVVKERTEGRP